ncbi:MAG: SDR family oxidoreductase [Succinivibrio sp.]|jgi:short-subunit dehydrogenase|nr:SDR family oxidoreductase [Succinivibrio sp.]
MANLALVTGASQGLGYELARCHAAQGGDLVITARDQARLDEVKAEIEKSSGVRVTAIAQDLSLPGSAQTLYLKIRAQGLKVETLINNAGAGCDGSFADQPLDDDLALLTLNIMALTVLTKLFLKDMLSGNGGRILNVSSIASLLPGPYMGIYYASKAYVTSFTKALWQETHGSKVSVTALLPGPMATGFVKASRLQHSAVASWFTARPEAVARAGYRAMLRGRRCVIAGTPWWLTLLLLVQPLCPERLVLWIMELLQRKKLPQEPQRP